MQIAHLFDDAVLEKIEYNDNYGAYISCRCSDYNTHEAKQKLLFCGIDLGRKANVCYGHSSSKHFVCHLDISLSSKTFDAVVTTIRSGFSKIHAHNITTIYSSVKAACSTLLEKFSPIKTLLEVSILKSVGCPIEILTLVSI